MFLVQFIFILCFCLNSVTGQACDTFRDTPQCSDGERCSDNTCEPAVNCSDGYGPCAATPGLYCRSEYCQPNRCNSTGQCVHGQVCQRENYSLRSCVYRVLLDAEEGSTVTLPFVEPSNGAFLLWFIYWYREVRSLIAYVKLEIRRFPDFEVNNYTLHYGRDKAEIDTKTLVLTLLNVTIEEEGFYYYDMREIFTGIELKYEYRLKLNVTPSATIQGVPDKPVETGTNLTLTCTAVKVNTEFTEIYWVVGGRNESGTNTTEHGVINISLVHEVTIEDEGNPIICVVVPRFGQTITVEKTINPRYAPIGKPMIEVSTKGQYNGEKVTLTCENPEVAGNPPCNAYDWIKQGRNSSNLPENLTNTKVYTFIMNDMHQGTYTCQCSNIFGESEFSDEVEMVYLGERPEISSKISDNKVGLIAGCVSGVLAVLVVVAVIVCKKYNIKFNICLNIQTKTRNLGTTEAGGQENEGYEIPVRNLEPSNTDNNNTYQELVNRLESQIPNEMPRHYITPLNTDDTEEHLEPENRPQSEIYSEIPNEMPIQDVTPLNIEDREEHLEPVNRPDEYLEPVNRRDEYLEPVNRHESEIPNEMPRHYVTPLNTDDREEHLEPVNRPDEYLEPVNRRDEYLEPVNRLESEIPNEMPRHYVTPLNTEDRADYEEPSNRPQSEMHQYDYINEEDMERHRQAGFVNTAFPTYEEIHVGNPESEYTNTNIV